MTTNKQQIDLTAEDVLAHLLANIPGYLYWKNKEGVYLACNNYHAQRLGLKLGKEAIGKRDEELLDKDANQRFSRDDEQVMAQGQTRVIEEEIILRNLPVILLSLKAPFMAKKKRVLGMLSISQDITRERQLEERVRLLKEVNNQLAIKELPPSPTTKILIVENNPIATNDLRDLFAAKTDCEVVTVAERASVLKQVKKERYALIVMDMNLADEDDVHLVQTIRTQPVKNQTTPIIGVNAYR